MHFPTCAIIPWLISLTGVLARSGHDIKQEMQARARGLENSPRDISHCAAQLQGRGFVQRTAERRAEILRSEREKRGLPTDPVLIHSRNILENRDGPSVLKTSHLSPISYNPNTPLSTIFAGNKTCILVPETTEGPYYVSGELIVIDVSTCNPLPDIMVDIWAANATGVYSGIVNSGNGNGDPRNQETIFGRGLQMTSKEGVAKFTAFFPGHYTSRTQHIHVATHLEGVIWNNNTFQGSTVAHIGQIFFDQFLSNTIQKTPIYKANKQPLTTKAQDGIFAQEAALGDPVIEYSHISNNVEDGVFAWISFGIDVKKRENIAAENTHH